MPEINIDSIHLSKSLVEMLVIQKDLYKEILYKYILNYLY